jgi:hypothetical protein
MQIQRLRALPTPQPHFYDSLRGRIELPRERTTRTVR